MSDELAKVEVAMAPTPASGEIDVQVATARRYPRDVATFMRRARNMAVGLDAETAASCYYSLKRGGTLVEGPSARLAEICASAWGHMRCQARIKGEEGDFIVAEGIAWDMETNVLMSQEVRRRIVGRDGQRYSSDMIAMTANAAASIALRNAVFRVIPRAYVDQLFREARAQAVGDAPSLKENARAAVAWFVKAGATEEAVFAHLGCGGIESVTLEDVAHLRGLATAIRDGDATLESALAPADAPEPVAGMQSLPRRRGRPTNAERAARAAAEGAVEE